MEKEFILVVDFGTSNVRAVAVDASNGSIAGSGSNKYPLLSPRPGYCEIAPELAFDLSVKCVKQVVGILDECYKSYSVCALSFSFFGDNILPADANGRPLYNLIQCFDTRAKAEVDFICQRLKQENLHSTPEEEFDLFSTAAKIRWLRSNFPEAAHYFTLQQYVLARLGLPAVNDITMGNTKRTMKARTVVWWDALLQVMDVKPQELGEIVSADTVIGTITRYGTVPLPNPVRVVPGGHDCDCGFLGVGLSDTQEGILGDITGTFEHVGYIFRDLEAFDRKNPSPSAYVCPGLTKGSWIALDATDTSGALLEWFMREINGDTSAVAYEKMWKDVQFNGELPIRVGGDFSIGEGTISGLNLKTSKQDLFAGIVESVTFKCKGLIEAVASSSPVPITKVRIGGGTAKSAQWNQLRADLTGLPFECMESVEVSALGAAIVAAYGIGRYGSINEALDSMVKVNRSYTPSEDVFKRYRTRY